jgi:Tfp pilus assembly protein PilF
VPGWGAAEVYLYLAKCYLDRGATLEARDALERALLIAPEFAEARRLMAKFTSG